MPIKPSAPRSVLVVCLGNICRSPTAEEALRQKAAVAGMTLQVDSAGTGDWHLGEHPDVRSQKHAKARGYNLSNLVSRQVTPQDFIDYDLILAMDSQNLEDLEAIRDKVITKYPSQKESDNEIASLALFSEEDPNYSRQDVPDPYQGGDEGFEIVIDRIESSVDAWIESWKRY